MKTKNIIIVGSGGFAKEIYSYIKHDLRKGLLANVRIKGFIDKNLTTFSSSGISDNYLGDEFSYPISDEDYFIVAIGYTRNNLRKRIIETLENRGAKFFSYIHPNSFVSDDSTVEEGVVICPYCVVTGNAVIKKHAVLNIYSSIAHDCLLGEHAILSPYATINGAVKAGSELFMGTKAVILGGLTIGDRCRVSVGAVLTKNIEDDTYVFSRIKSLLKKK